MKSPRLRSKEQASLINDEAPLLARLKQGEHAAQAWLVEAHRERLYRAAVHFLGWRDPDAEDVVQETFVLAFRSIQGFEGRSRLYTWLNQICARLCFKRLRQRQRVALGAEADLRESLQVPAHGDDALHALLDQERRGLMQRALAIVSGLCREILERRDLRGQAYAEAARGLKLPMGTFMSRLSRCREQLRAKVQELQR
jgi:RNA polymerase sigma-70 factor (ECF subfamily)